MSTHNDDLKKARETEAALVEQRAATCVRLVEIDEKRQALAFEALTEGGKARKELDALNRERLLIVSELEMGEVAIAEAQKRVAAAEHEVEREGVRAKAREVRRILDAGGERGVRIAKAAETLRDELTGLFDDLDHMRRLGVPVAGGRLVQLSLTRSLFAIMREAGLEVDVIPPGQRHPPQEIVAHYLVAGSAWASNILGDARPLKSVEAA